MFGAADLAEPALRLFTRVLTDSASTEPAADAMTLWLSLHGLADQRASARSSSRFTELAPRLSASLARI